jgi:ABC-type transport system involved in cytochrome c biogenesis ATPase subunit
VTRVRLIVPVADGVDLSVDKEVDSFRMHIGRLRVEVGAGQLVVRTGPDGAGAVELLRVDADEGPKS